MKKFSKIKKDERAFEKYASIEEKSSSYDKKINWASRPAGVLGFYS